MKNKLKVFEIECNLIYFLRVYFLCMIMNFIIWIYIIYIVFKRYNSLKFCIYLRRWFLIIYVNLKGKEGEIINHKEI